MAALSSNRRVGGIYLSWICSCRQPDGEFSFVLRVPLAVEPWLLCPRLFGDRRHQFIRGLFAQPFAAEIFEEFIAPTDALFGLAELEQERPALGTFRASAESGEDLCLLFFQPFIEKVFQRMVFRVTRYQRLVESLHVLPFAPPWSGKSRRALSRAAVSAWPSRRGRGGLRFRDRQAIFQRDAVLIDRYNPNPMRAGPLPSHGHELPIT